MFHRQQLVGQWHRSENQGKEHYSEIAQLNADGSFVFTFYTHTIDGTLLEEISETGDWGLVGDIHFTITKTEIDNNREYPADKENEDNYQAYQITKLTDLDFTYQHVLTGETYTLARVVGVAN